MKGFQDSSANNLEAKEKNQKKLPVKFPIWPQTFFEHIKVTGFKRDIIYL